MSELFATQAVQNSISLYNTYASWDPWGAQFVLAVRKGALLLSTYGILVVPAESRLPIKTLGFVVALFAAAKTRYLIAHTGGIL